MFNHSPQAPDCNIPGLTRNKNSNHEKLINRKCRYRAIGNNA